MAVPAVPAANRRTRQVTQPAATAAPAVLAEHTETEGRVVKVVPPQALQAGRSLAMAGTAEPVERSAPAAQVEPVALRRPLLVPIVPMAGMAELVAVPRTAISVGVAVTAVRQQHKPVVGMDAQVPVAPEERRPAEQEEREEAVERRVRRTTPTIRRRTAAAETEAHPPRGLAEPAALAGRRSAKAALHKPAQAATAAAV